MFMEAPRSSLRVRYGSFCCSTAPAAQGLFSCPWGLRLRACTDARASQCSATSTQSENRPTLKAPSLQPLRLRLAPSLNVRLDSTLKPHLCQALKLHLRLRLDMAASVTTLAPAVFTPSTKRSMGSTQQAGGSSGGHWSWWHKGAPHSKRVVGDHAEVDPGVPRCKCCYYTTASGVGPGWYLGVWSTTYESFTWQWNDHGAPHAPGFVWDTQDDARFMAPGLVSGPANILGDEDDPRTDDEPCDAQ